MKSIESIKSRLAIWREEIISEWKDFDLIQYRDEALKMIDALEAKIGGGTMLRKILRLIVSLAVGIIIYKVLRKVLKIKC